MAENNDPTETIERNPRVKSKKPGAARPRFLHCTVNNRLLLNQQFQDEAARPPDVNIGHIG